jgi:hypothetical protein
VTTIWLLLLPFLLAVTILWPYLQPLVVSAMQEQPQPLVLGLPLVAIGVAQVGLLSFGPPALGVISFGGSGVLSFGSIGIVSFGGGALSSTSALFPGLRTRESGQIRGFSTF